MQYAEDVETEGRGSTCRLLVKRREERSVDQNSPFGQAITFHAAQGRRRTWRQDVAQEDPNDQREEGVPVLPIGMVFDVTLAVGLDYSFDLTSFRSRRIGHHCFIWLKENSD